MYTLMKPQTTTAMDHTQRSVALLAPAPHLPPAGGRVPICCNTIQSVLQSLHQSVHGPECSTWNEA